MPYYYILYFINLRKVAQGLYLTENEYLTDWSIWLRRIPTIQALALKGFPIFFLPGELDGDPVLYQTCRVARRLGQLAFFRCTHSHKSCALALVNYVRTHEGSGVRRKYRDHVINGV